MWCLFLVLNNPNENTTIFHLLTLRWLGLTSDDSQMSWLSLAWLCKAIRIPTCYKKNIDPYACELFIQYTTIYIGADTGFWKGGSG